MYLGKKYLMIFLAVNLIGVAVALILESGLGCDPIGLLCDGISHIFSIKIGIASFAYNVLIIALALVFARSNLGMGTIVYGLLSGFFIDFYCFFLEILKLKSQNIAVNILEFILGEICMSLAFAILMKLQLGMTALDAVLVSIEKKLHISYANVKIVTDILFVITGIITGGVFGVGTVFSALITGKLVSKFTQIIGYFQQREIHSKYKKYPEIGGRNNVL